MAQGRGIGGALSPPLAGAAELAARLGCEFADLRLLDEALSHPSAVNEPDSGRTVSNQRLEFLGDAAVNLAVALEVYRLRPDWDEGRLTAARSELVCDETLAAVAEEIDLGRHLVLGRGEDAMGGRSRPSNLAAGLEAVVGARLLDAGSGAAMELVVGLLGERLDSAGTVAEVNPKRVLQELVQSRGSSTPTYSVIECSGAPHAPTYVCEVRVDGNVAGRGSGHRKAAAEREAARRALGDLAQEAAR